MKRVFLILVILFSSFSMSLSFAQDEELDEEFFEDEPLIDPLDEPISAPPGWEGDEPPPETNSPRPLPRPSGGGFRGGSAPYVPPSGEIEFRLVEPLMTKPTKPPLRIPMRIRKQVDQKVKEEMKRRE